MINNIKLNTPIIKDENDFWIFVECHLDVDPARLRLDWHNRQDTVDFDIDDAILQIECRQRFGRKLAETLCQNPRFYFPSTLSGEQSTSDQLATYHARFVNENDTLVDLTAGLGIDVLHLARKCCSTVAIERTEHTADALRYNVAKSELDNIKVLTGDCRDALDDLEADVAFIDPARRGADGNRVFGLIDCEPNVLDMLPELSESFKRLIIKVSPMLDISKLVNDIPAITDVYAIGTNTECREIVTVVVFNNPTPKPVRIHSVTLRNQGQTSEFSFTHSDEASAEAIYAENLPTSGDILYEPYPATMKAAPFRLLSKLYGLTKLNSNTHLYVGKGDEVVAKHDFPGEQFKIIEVIPWQSKHIKRFASRYPRISLSVRNFGMSAADLRRKLGTSDGGELRLFAVSIRQAPGRRQTAGGASVGDRLLIVAEPIKS